MFLSTLINIIVAIILILAVLYLLFRLYAWQQGNERIVMLVKRHTPFIVEDISFSQVTLTCDIPFVNKGRQNGTIMDLYPRHLMPEEQFDGVHIETWTMDVSRPRHDGYWESVIIPPRKDGTVRLRVIMSVKDGNIRKELMNFPDMPIDIVYQVVGRSDWHISKNRLVLTSEELEQAMRQ